MDAFVKGRTVAKQELINRYKPTKFCSEAKKNIEQLRVLVEDFSKKGISDNFFSGVAYEYKARLEECIAYYNFGDCDNYFAKKKLEVVSDIINKESIEAQSLVSKQTEKQNKVVLFIGASIMLVGLFIIVKK